VLFVLGAVEAGIVVSPRKEIEEAGGDPTNLGYGVYAAIAFVASSVIGFAAALAALGNQRATTHIDVEVIGTMAAQLVCVVLIALLVVIAPVVKRKRGDPNVRHGMFERWRTTFTVMYGLLMLAPAAVPFYALASLAL
jgi:hypothetical protein